MVILTSCGTTGSGVLYTERSIDPMSVNLQRVAILPNRLPLNLTDPEMWKKYNWEVMRRRFEKEGMQVIDFTTSVEMFNKSGLPLEDTKVSRDKYAELAEELGADILIFPYYGTSYRVTGITDKNNYEITGSLQVYLAEENDFMTRIDIEGNNFIHSFNKLAPFVSLGIVIGSTLTYDETLMLIGGIAGGVASLYPILPFLTPIKKRYERAFRYAINEGLDQFFRKYKVQTATLNNPARPVQSKTTPLNNPPVQQPAVKKDEPVKQVLVQSQNTNPTPSSVQPVTGPAEKPLSHYSMDELERMKIDAVNAKDFRKAQAIKDEIDKRNNR